ncbi:coiled-coil domain-containing protein 169-like [Rhopilema esculentum]|uniref:coiled-coil domain-containing protein 169-like n=1 Tax=Rhopilema esculentum TaxID=499914 RepID=UPI0031D7F281
MDAEIERLKGEINQEEQAKEMLEQSIADLTKTANELVDELELLEENNGEEEWKERYNEQVEMNKNLEKQILMLKDKMKELKGELERGNNVQTSELDQMNEIELKRLIKQLEREKHELDGNLKDLEWQLDTEAKSRYKIYEEIQEYKATTNENNALKDIKTKFPVYSKIPSKTRYYGIPDNQRILDPSKGPVRRTAAAGRLPKIGSREGTSSVKSSPGPTESTAHVKPRGYNSAEDLRTKYGKS